LLLEDGRWIRSTKVSAALVHRFDFLTIGYHAQWHTDQVRKAAVIGFGRTTLDEDSFSFNTAVHKFMKVAGAAS
jgi:hypothetical protein